MFDLAADAPPIFRRNGNSMPHLTRITLYPIKSLDPVDVAEARLLPGGALEWDRRWALVDPQGDPVTAKRTAQMHPIRATYDLAARCVTLAVPTAAPQTFSLTDDPQQIADYVGHWLGMTLTLRENTATGYPDDLEAPGPTVVGRETLEQVATWYPGQTLDQMRWRFRANLEISGGGPWWEERLYGLRGKPLSFRIGTVELSGVNPCARCVVPSRDPHTGERWGGFAKDFEQHRQESLPEWAERSRFDHYYRLAVNTAPLTSAGGLIRLGDDVVAGSRSSD